MSKRTTTRQTILESATQIASVEGLEGISIGKLADALNMSKSGIFAHFGSKEELQIATLDTAWDTMTRFLFSANPQSPGLPQLAALLEGWLHYLEDSPFQGGCVFMAASTEYDSRPGRVRDHLLGLVSQGHAALLNSLIQASDLQQIGADADPRQLAFELFSYLQGAHNMHRLTGDSAYFQLARQAIRSVLQAQRPGDIA